MEPAHTKSTNTLAWSRRLGAYSGDAVLLGALLVPAVLLVPRAGVTVTAEAMSYLNEAWQVYAGEEIVFAGRGPIFRLLLAAGFAVFGVSVQGAFLATRVFYVLDVVVVFLIARVFYGRLAATVAAVLAISCYGLHVVTGFLNIDTLIVFFNLTFLLLSYAALESSRKAVAVAAGIWLGLGLLTKETALAFGVIPFVAALCVPRYRNRRSATVLTWLLATSAAVLLPWVGMRVADPRTDYTILGAAAYTILGAAAPAVAVSPESYPTYGSFLYEVFVVGLFRNLATFYRVFLAESVILPSLSVMGWLALTIRAVSYRQAEDVLLVLSGLVWLPIMAYAAAAGDRTGQGLEFFLLSQIVAAFWISWLVRTVAATAAVPSALRRAAEVTLVLVTMGTIAAYAWLNSRLPMTWLLVGPSSPPRWQATLFHSDGFTVDGRFSQDLADAAEWLAPRASPEDTILAVGSGAAVALQFASGFRLNPVQFEIERAHWQILAESDTNEALPRPLFVMPHYRFDERQPRFRTVEFVFEDDLLDAIKQRRATYFVLAERGLFYALYFESTDWARLVYERDTVRIYAIEGGRVEQSDGPTLVSNSYRSLMEYWREAAPGEFAAYEGLLARMGLTSEEVGVSTYEAFQRSWTLAHVPLGARVAFSFHTGEFLVPDDYDTAHFGQDDVGFALMRAERPYRYFFIHNTRRRNRELPKLLAELGRVGSLVKWPTVFNFGEGWEVYALPEVPPSVATAGTDQR